METIKNGKKWQGAYANNVLVNGLYKAGTKFYEKPMPHFSLEYTDTSDTNYREIYFDEETLKSKISSMQYSIKTCKLSSKNGIKITSMYGLFYYCQNLTSVDLSSLDTSDATSIERLFSYCPKLINVNLKNFNTSNVTNMMAAFSSCPNLTNLDLSYFDTKNTLNMNFMFSGCTYLAELDISNFSFDNVQYFNSVFSNVPSDCLIYVKDLAAKTYLRSKTSNTLTNIQIKENV